MTAAFAPSAPLSLGVEEEMMIVDAATHDQVGAVELLLAGVRERTLPGALKQELHASVVELATGVCADVAGVDAATAALRAAAADAAGAHGLAVAAAGTHPFADPEAQPIADEERYRDFVGYAGVTARRQGVQGLHVHVGMPSPDACWQALEWMLPWLPLVLAVSANSPYLGGRATGLASNRAGILGQLPRTGAPPPLGSYSGWEEWVDRLVKLGVAADHTRLWWDVRPHPTFGTVEVRMPDQPTGRRRTVAFAALVQALAATALDDPPARPCDRGYYQQNRWAAARFGPEAELIHPEASRALRVPELWRELLERVRPAARRLGTLDLIEAIDPATCEGALQLGAGSPSAAAADVVRRTVG